MVLGSLELHSHDRFAIGFPPKTVQVKFTESPVRYMKLWELDDIDRLPDGGSTTEKKWALISFYRL